MGRYRITQSGNPVSPLHASPSHHASLPSRLGRARGVAFQAIAATFLILRTNTLEGLRLPRKMSSTSNTPKKSGKRIQITSNTHIDAERLHEEVRNHNSGKTKIVDRQEPHKIEHSKTITGNPGKVKALDDDLDDTPASTTKSPQEHPATVGLDASQL